ncbi:endoglucanase [Parabacteroides sp. PF5-5]|uniref:glycoside hydrolase family 9 protein n=1 Tax=unclassified Parabacteroides TaxID=2649774 RepID=UPI002475DDEA|nr:MULTISPECIES: glycoside hydrolase family 9 protein [unclassified Parabacteroides]MDH6303424.1 endoglucanase [Parabacteroides sp. PH5-39]MDH6314747.1 endoglucanase [Parabacteroides sp. PF5-13]MDH6318084.1 endoglucanase [Parabacteroides sp. PH5-13]MDH6321985.1 endoglucanase [Parabacteroides sp. PH5-8]MDH6326108.1 endoglucanase [Parabacteroides sp. PH5-41]
MIKKTFCIVGLCIASLSLYSQGFKINSADYFQNEGANVMVFSDVYPEGHQGGVTLVMNSFRLAANGDIRFEVSQGQWQGLPKLRKRTVDKAGNNISVTLSYPDSSKHKAGFNPMLYLDYAFNYTINVKGEGENIIVTVDLDTPVPERFAGKIGFNLELFPGILMGKPWILDSKTGIFPSQPYGPTLAQESNTKHIGDFNPNGKADVKHLLGDGTYSPMVADDIIASPFARGKQFVLNPDDPYSKITFESRKGDLVLYDGRMNHNNGWFILRTEIPAGVSKGAIEWVITPQIQKDWMYTPIVQTSQIGYHPNQPKVAVIELDDRDSNIQEPVLYKITGKGREVALKSAPSKWGKFLRYNYLHFDFSSIKEEGLYQVVYGESKSNTFRISNDIYDWGVWQPMLEYFLPVQMCHMRVNEKYRVWHDFCHTDDAKMAPVDLNHIDGYVQGPSTLTKYKPGDLVPGLNIGGWHDAGDYDLRIESQAGEAYILSLAQENFGIDYWDETSINQQTRITEIHQPDGKPDILQQIEHGALSIVAGYQALGRLYRGIICNTVRQYTHLGDASAHTDNVSGNDDDRWVFTEDNPRREMTTAAQLAAVYRVLKNFNDTLSNHCLNISKELYQVTRIDERSKSAKIHAAVELYLATGEKEYKDYVLSEREYIAQNIGRCWFIGRFDNAVKDKKFSAAIRKALPSVLENYTELASRSPYGLPPDRGNRTSGSWDVQSMGYYYCFYQDAYPDLFKPDYIFNAVNFILGCHPGSNTTSFVSGVGVKSATTAYGVNRADWSHIPGGVIPGTVLIRPDLPELYDFPFIWQEQEYCLGGEASYFMYMVLAAQKILKNN